MNSRWPIPRRTFLKGLGTVMALPWLEGMHSFKAAAAAGGSPTVPKRMAFVYLPNGADMARWTPAEEGGDFKLPWILEPLAPHQKDLLVMTGLTHDKARPNGDGAGDHARACATFLTGCQARKTDGADIKVGVSIDQVLARRIGHHTRLPSLEVGCDQGKTSGNCDSGYSCAYSFNIAWKSASLPLPPEVNPRLVFERLFASQNPQESTEARERRARQNKSVLDFVLEDARQLQRQLGATDRRKLDEYLASVRELELRLESAEKFASTVAPHAEKPNGIPREFEQHVRLMYDLIALAFQTDSTRIATFVVAHDGSNRSYRNLEISEGHHELSHHGNNQEKKDKIAKINRFHVTQFAHFLERLKSIPEGSGSLLDHSMVVYGSGISDGNRHNHDDLPALLAGRAGGAIHPGRHVRFARNTPMANLFLAMADLVGAPLERHGDSSGKLRGLG